MILPERQTGQTTKQMLAAPTGSIFVCPGYNPRYYRKLAHQLNLRDLVVMPLDSTLVFHAIVRQLAHNPRLCVVIDHSAPLPALGEEGKRNHAHILELRQQLIAQQIAHGVLK